MIDLHSHVLPDLDDGAQHLEDSLALAREAVDSGVTVLYATPHHRNGVYNNEKEDIIQCVDYLQQQLDAQGISVQILPGQEIHVYGEIVEDIKQDRILTYNNEGKYILLELPYDQVPSSIERILYEIQLLGITPIIPHPERNQAIRKHPGRLYDMVKRGALTQLTAASILGKFGRDVQRFSLQCIEHNLSHLIASDAHRAGRRGIVIAEAYRFIEKQYGAYVSQQLKRNADTIHQGEDVYVDPPERIERKKKSKFFSLFRGRRS